MTGDNQNNEEVREKVKKVSDVRSENERLYEVVPEWLDDSNFSQLFGGLTEMVDVRADEGNIISGRSDVNVDEINNFVCDESNDSKELHDSDYEMNVDNEVFEENVDHLVEFVGIQKKGKQVNDYCVDYPDIILKGKYREINCMSSGDDKSMNGSDEDICEKWPTFNPTMQLDSHYLQVGMLFNNKEEFKAAVRDWSIQNGKAIKFIKNDKRRCRIICRRKNCPFVIYISKHDGNDSWQIRMMQEHTCTWTYHNKTLNSTLIAKKFVNKIRVNPQLKCHVFRKEVIEDMKLHVTKVQARKALKKARVMIHMKEEDQFNKVWDYCLEIANTNPGTTISVLTSRDTDMDGRKRFVRLYVCFDACKKGFEAGCRPLVGVDGCFLKGQQGGQLLTAVTLDGNNNIFPIAWAVVEAENRSSWEWFLDLLSRDLHIFENQEMFTFISDKQKGLLPAFENILPYVTNRFCVRHLHQNFKLAGFSGVALKNALWAAAKATTVNQFTSCMENLKNLNSSAFKWLNEKTPREWSRSHFNFTSKCDALLNNMCECFNAFIVDSRELPIISMLESIRLMVMTRILENKDKAMKWEDMLCPRAKEVLGRNMQEAGACIGVKSDDDNYEIRTMYGAQYVVDLVSRSCSCRRWELTGLPCVHACAAINMCFRSCEEFVDPCYFVETYRRIYEYNIKPINGVNEWPKSDRVPPLPPNYKKPKRGRPPKMRRRAPDEQPLTSQGKKLGRGTVVLHCSKCKQVGHNSRACGKKAQKVVVTTEEIVS